jgi:fumarate reductase flavoprotein subunit
MERIAVDVAVVGAGFAGLVTAVRAQELGARVAVLEHSDVAPSWSSSRMSGGSLAVAMGRPDDPPAEIAARLQRARGEPADEALVRTWAESCGRVYRWLRARGTRFVQLYDGVVMAPVRPNRLGHQWAGRGPDLTVRRLYADLLRGGGLYFGHTAARELRQQDGRVVGLVAQRLDPPSTVEIASRAVVLADGGFQSNPALLRKHAGIPCPERILVRGAGTNAGTGLELALAAGARLDSPEALFVHLMHGEALQRPLLEHFPVFDRLATRAIVVAPDGSRFVDENLGALAVGNRLARLPDPASAWVVFDRARWETDGRHWQAVPPNPNLVVGGARLEVADDAATLARRIGLPPDALAATVAEFNETLATGEPARLPVPRTGAPPPLRPPLVAAPLAVGLTYTIGGPLVDEFTRVVDTAGNPILGLHAAGTTAGGLGGGPKPASAGGIALALALGLMAGEYTATGRIGNGARPTPP